MQRSLVDVIAGNVVDVNINLFDSIILYIKTLDVETLKGRLSNHTN